MRVFQGQICKLEVKPGFQNVLGLDGRRSG